MEGWNSSWNCQRYQKHVDYGNYYADNPNHHYGDVNTYADQHYNGNWRYNSEPKTSRHDYWP